MTKRHIESIARGRVRLRLLAESDLPKTLAWRNQDRVRKWFINQDMLAPEQHRRWFEDYLKREDDFVFIVEETQDMLKPIGQLAIYKIDLITRRAEFGRLMIGESDAVGKGLAKEATMLALEVAFGKLGLMELEAFIKSANIKAQAALLAVGFREAAEQDGMKRLVAFASSASAIARG